jgi:PAS domain S-box-containing protein
LNSALEDDRVVGAALLALKRLPTEADVVQETFLGEALEHAPVGALVLDEIGRYLAANRTACRMMGYSREELLQLHAGDLAADPTTLPARLEAMANGRLEHGTTQLRREDGTLLPVEFRVGATRSGGLPYFVFMFWHSAPDDS